MKKKTEKQKSNVVAIEISIHHNWIGIKIRRKFGDRYDWSPSYLNVTPSSLARVQRVMNQVHQRRSASERAAW